jgi:hypothetical protein
MLFFVSNLGREPVVDVQFTQSCTVETSSQLSQTLFTFPEKVKRKTHTSSLSICLVCLFALFLDKERRKPRVKSVTI